MSTFPEEPEVALQLSGQHHTLGYPTSWRWLHHLTKQGRMLGESEAEGEGVVCTCDAGFAYVIVCSAHVFDFVGSNVEHVNVLVESRVQS